MSTSLQTEITAPELYARLNRGEDFVILDVRNEDEFKLGAVEGRHGVPQANIPYFDFIEDADAALAKVPFTRDQEIVVVCAKGGSSEFVSELLRDAGYRTINLIGGMRDWKDFYAFEDLVPPSNDLQIVQFNRPAKASLSYLIGSQGEALIVDPNRNIQPYLDEAERRGLTIRHVMDTHVHADYISGGVALAQAAGATYHLSGSCGFEGDLSTDGQPGTIPLGAASARKIATPGHTPGSMSLLVNDTFLLTGDTVFVRSVGRPDLGGQAEPWARQLYHTLTVTLADMPDETVVLPSHYSCHKEMRDDFTIAGSLGEIRRQNDGMQAESEEAFIAYIKRNMRPSPESYARIRQVNLAVLRVDEAELSELDLGKNECAASTNS
jgi:glyoxylase-like metal-dependent hydrolase (beta-lactamase superfamily II)/rhodanese-related sulfurtransferase